MKGFIPILNHPNYLINNLGQVYSLINNKILKNQFYKIGYPYIRIDKKSYLIHRLVAIHFVKNPHDKPNVHHKDNNPKNPLASNLIWCTQAENLDFAFKSGRKGRVITMSRIDNEYSPTCKFSNKDIEAMRMLYEMGYFYSQISKMFPISVGYFHRVVNKGIRTLRA